MLSRLRPSWRLALGLGVVLIVGATSTCSNPTDDSENYLPVPTKGGDGGGGPVACGKCDCLKAGTWYRFNELSLTSLDGYTEHGLMNNLNDLWKADIAANQLNFFMEVKDVSDTEVTMRVVNGARLADKEELCLLDYTSVLVVHPRNGCCLGASKTTAMNVYAGTDANPKNCAPSLPVKHAIPVGNAVLDTVVLNDAVDGCDEVSGTVLSGTLAVESLENICTCLSGVAEKCGTPDPSFVDGKELGCAGCNSNFFNLMTFLKVYPPKLGFNCSSADGKPAACLTAHFSGLKIDAPPPDCQ